MRSLWAQVMLCGGGLFEGPVVALPLRTSLHLPGTSPMSASLKCFPCLPLKKLGLSMKRHHELLNLAFVAFTQTPSDVCLVLDLLHGGTLSYLLGRQRRLSENMVSFFVACIVSGLQVRIAKSGHRCINGSLFCRLHSNLLAVNSTSTGTALAWLRLPRR